MAKRLKSDIETIEVVDSAASLLAAPSEYIAKPIPVGTFILKIVMFRLGQDLKGENKITGQKNVPRNFFMVSFRVVADLNLDSEWSTEQLAKMQMVKIFDLQHTMAVEQMAELLTAARCAEVLDAAIDAKTVPWVRKTGLVAIRAEQQKEIIEQTIYKYKHWPIFIVGQMKPSKDPQYGPNLQKISVFTTEQAETFNLEWIEAESLVTEPFVDQSDIDDVI